jgi:hypothetical protein
MYSLDNFVDILAEIITGALNSNMIVRYRSMVRVLIGSVGGIIIYFASAYYLKIPEVNVFSLVLGRFKRK